MNQLERKMADRIQKAGPITFDSYMEMALYEPGLGYYTSEQTEIGKSGDFYTSQHLHSVFGSMLGKQIKEMWEIMGRPPDFHIVEFGAGAGLTCLDILSYLEKRNIFSSFSYAIVELNPFFRQKQESLLKRYHDAITWVSSLKELQKFRGCLLSNELLDSFPVHLIMIHDGLKEIYIDLEDGIFYETVDVPSTNAIPDYLKEFSIDLPEGYRTEVNLRIKDWLRSVSDVLSEGFIFTIDYGYPAYDYYSEDRNRGTLLCYHRHQINEDPYQNIGRQDITTHVNFSSLKKWGEEFGFQTMGFCQQSPYLISLGIDELINELRDDSPDYLFELARIKRLIFPGTLGETHKVMIQYKGPASPNLKGFAIKNQKDRL